MEDMSYYAPVLISLESLASVAELNNYDYSLSFLPSIGVDKKLEIIHTYTRGASVEHELTFFYDNTALYSDRSDKESFGEFEWESLNRLQPKSMFAVGFRVYTMRYTIGFLRKVLEHYGGHVNPHITSRWYTIDDIDELMELYPDMEKG